MRATTCVCGTSITTDGGVDDLVVATREHFAAAHPDLQLTDTQIRNYIEREEQLTGATERLDTIGTMEVVDLAPEHVEDVLRFFDRDGFADNPAWASCYCLAHHVRGGEATDEWAARTWQQNRDDLAQRIGAGATTGTLAYVDGRLAGWCNASCRAEYPGDATGTDDDRTGFVACFVIAPPYRRHGLARQLLTEAVEQFGRRGMTAVQAHPATEPNSPAGSYRGTIPLFEAAGFEVVEHRERIAVMRKELPEK